VLGLPPAFVLSQDQTLKLNENSNRLVTISSTHRLNDAPYDESQAHLFSSEPENHDELDKRDRQSLYLPSILANTWRKDLAVHVSLSSDLIVKQQVGAGLTPNSETLSIPTKKAGYKNPRSSGEASASAAQWRRRRRWAGYRSNPRDLSTRVLKKRHERGPESENTTHRSPIRGGTGLSSKPAALWISFVARGPFSRVITRKISQNSGVCIPKRDFGVAVPVP
jgi:hypothetical protein